MPKYSSRPSRSPLVSGSLVPCLGVMHFRQFWRPLDDFLMFYAGERAILLALLALGNFDCALVSGSLFCVCVA